jgi:hypothetical protein
MRKSTSKETKEIWHCVCWVHDLFTGLKKKNLECLDTVANREKG